ncbi:MAG: hypothetical protein ICV77_02400 [Cyanobacteria bacterium Co-bin8]|nr:hypothetical protein [Cyanobacteria bacterium Co-bin8]
MRLLTPLAAAAILFAIVPTAAAEISADSFPELERTQEISIQADAPTAEETGIAQGTLECPPGQFLSPFSDVRPTDWAYSAVVALAGVPLECFGPNTVGQAPLGRTATN